MKKVLLTAFLALFLTGCTTALESKELSVLPLFSTVSNAENKVWVGTFQLVFNDMKNNIIKRDVKFKLEPMSQELKGLNAEEFSSSMLDESSYYTSYGETSPQAKEKIKADIKEKFNETSTILDKLDWRQDEGRFYAYAMLKKEFEFLKQFNKLPKSSFNSSKETYDFFGIDESSENLETNVRVLFYNNSQDYAVQLFTKTQDTIYLYRTENNSSFKDIYNNMHKKTEKYSGNSKFRETDTLKVPNLKLNKTKEYPELCDKEIEGTDFYFSNAIETIEIELNERGGKVKSEAALMLETCGIEILDESKPRHFNFDKTFVMFLVDKNKQDPYFAIRVKDLKDFQ